MRNPLFTVIIPTYNRPELLAEAMTSVLTQSITDLEVLVVDDGSNAPAPVPSDARVRIIHHASNMGAATARNTGIYHSRGRYVTFLDDDDLYTPDRLQLALEGFTGAPIAICWSRFLDLPSYGRRRLDGEVYDVILDETTPALGATAVDRSVLPMFDHRFEAVEDVDWWLRVARVTHVATVPRPGHLIRRHSGLRHRNGALERIHGSLRLMKTNPDYFVSHPRAAAFRWRRIAFLATSTQDYALARSAVLQAFRLDPDWKDVARYARALGLGRVGRG